MNKQAAIIVVPLALLALLLAGCNWNPTPVTGGSHDNPNVVVTASCSSWGEYALRVRYSPADLHILDVGVRQFRHVEDATPTGLRDATMTCAAFSGGRFDCRAIGNPNTLPNPFIFTVVYDPGTGVRASRDVPVLAPVCPEFAPRVQLVSITCLPDHQVSFVVDVGMVAALNSMWSFPCLGDEHCAGPGAYTYGPRPVFDPAHPDLLTFSGPAPTGPTPPMRFILRLAGSAPEDDNDLVILNGFYDRYIAACPESTPEPGPTVTVETSGGQPPKPSCESYLKPDACTAASCSWWSNGACHPDQEPPASVCSDYNFMPEKCAAAGCWYWTNTTCNTGQDPCSNYFDQTSCEKMSCSWDGKTCYTK